MKSPSQAAGLDQPREWFRDLLWRAFPGRSDRDVAVRASRVLGVSARQIQHWLQCENDPGWSHVAAVLVIAGFESAMRRIGGWA